MYRREAGQQPVATTSPRLAAEAEKSHELAVAKSAHSPPQIPCDTPARTTWSCAKRTGTTTTQDWTRKRRKVRESSLQPKLATRVLLNEAMTVSPNA